MRRHALAAALLPALAVAACAPPPAPPAVPPGEPEVVAAGPVEAAAEEAVEPAPEPLPVVALAPLWETVPRPEEGLAGVAVWPGAGQRPWLLVAAAASHRLVLFDAGTGELLRELGSLGERAGSFREPVGVAVAGDLAFVVERGNARVQVLRLPGLATVGLLGEGELERPAAVAVEPAAEGWTVWVAEEAVVVEEPPEAGAPPAEPGFTPPPPPAHATVHRFTVAADGSPLAGRPLRIRLPAGRVVALALDPGGAAALVAVASPDENVGSGRSTSLLDGRPVDVVDGAVAGADAFPCPAGYGWLVALPLGGFLALSPEGPAAGASLVLDGAAAPLALAVSHQPLAGLPAGTLYAVTDDSRVVAVGGGELAAALAPRLCD
jgi:3-phytase